jgi:hypothetical protein
VSECGCVCVCVCVCVALVIQHVIRLFHTAIYVLPHSTIFFYITLEGTIFENKVTEHKMFVLISSTNCVSNISHFQKNRARYDKKCLPVFMYESTLYSCPILTKV